MSGTISTAPFHDQHHETDAAKRKGGGRCDSGRTDVDGRGMCSKYIGGSGVSTVGQGAWALQNFGWPLDWSRNPTLRIINAGTQLIYYLIISDYRKIQQVTVLYPIE